MMETWQLLISFAGLMVALGIPAMARDRTMMGMIGSTRSDWERALSTAKDDTRKMVDAAIAPIHDRISRVRDEYVRRDDLDGHLGRWDKQFDDLRGEMRRQSDATNKRLDEITKLLTK